MEIFMRNFAPNDEWVDKYIAQKQFKPSVSLKGKEKRLDTISLQARISVEMGCCNFEKYIAEAIESVLAQTLKPYEFIISDDHSTDNSWEIIKYYAGKYPNLIRAFRTSENVGMKKCSILRKDMVSGDLLSMIDGDDRWLPQKLELEWEALRKHPEAKIAYSNVYIIDEFGNRNDIWYDGQGDPPPSGDVFVQTFAKRFFQNNRNVFRNPLIYFEVLKKLGYYDLDDHLIHVDWDRKIRMTAKNKVVYSGKALVEYRIHGKGIHNAKANHLFESANYIVNKNMHLLRNRSFKEIKYVESNVRSLLSNLSNIANLKQGEIEWPDFQKILNSANPVLINSLPKSGTNMLAKSLQLFLGFSNSTLHLGHSTINKFKEDQSYKTDFVKIGVDFQSDVEVSKIYNALKSLSNNKFATAHLPFSQEMAQILLELGIKMLVILRDPRDVVVSHAKYINSTVNHPLYKYYQTLNVEEQIMASITGVESDIKLQSIFQRIKSVLEWNTQPFVYTTYFEKLVGPKGGGSQSDQINELRNIANHLGIKSTESQLLEVAGQIFGGTSTFRKGKIGSWREAFSENHKKTFLRIAGHQLLELGYENDEIWIQSPPPKKKLTKHLVENQILGSDLIFLISQPRAGSTLLQRILGGNREIHTTAEPWIMLHPIYALKKKGLFAEFESNLARQGLEDFLTQVPEGLELYWKALRTMASTLYNRALELSGKRFFLDKTPRYHFIIPELQKVFPKAKFIILLRNPLAILSSTLKTWFQNNPENLKKSHNYMDIIQGPLNLIKGLQVLKQKAIIVKYEELVEDAENTVKAICYKLGITFQNEMLNYGSKPKPEGRFGDPVGIYQHSCPVTDNIDKWIDNISSPELVEFAFQYLKTLGSEIVSEMGYNFEELKQKLDSLRSSDNTRQANLEKVKILNREGESLAVRFDFTTALSKFQTALELDPNCAETHNNLGVIFHQKGDKENALAHYQKAIMLEPRNITYLKNIAYFHLAVLGNIKEAFQICINILRTHPQDIETLKILKKVCINLQKFEDAAIFYKQVIDIDPGNHEAKYYNSKLNEVSKLNQRQS